MNITVRTAAISVSTLTVAQGKGDLVFLFFIWMQKLQLRRGMKIINVKVSEFGNIILMKTGNMTEYYYSAKM